jgi:hypothetical protein
MKQLQTVMQQLYDAQALNDVDLHEVEDLAKDFPYYSIAQLLRAMRDEGNNAEANQRAAIHFQNPLWLHYLLADRSKSFPESLQESLETEPPSYPEVESIVAVENEEDAVLPASDVVPIAAVGVGAAINMADEPSYPHLNGQDEPNQTVGLNDGREEALAQAQENGHAETTTNSAIELQSMAAAEYQSFDEVELDRKLEWVDNAHGQDESVLEAPAETPKAVEELESQARAAAEFQAVGDVELNRDLEWVEADHGQDESVLEAPAETPSEVEELSSQARAAAEYQAVRDLELNKNVEWVEADHGQDESVLEAPTETPSVVEELESQARAAAEYQAVRDLELNKNVAWVDANHGQDESVLEEPMVAEATIEKVPAMANSHLAEAVAALKGELPTAEMPSEIPTQAYHAIDYFASQGIKLLEDESTDRLGRQLKSFTGWLKSMKKVGMEPVITGDEEKEKEIEKLAEKANVSKDILTEAMVDVLEKQGKYAKAIDLLEKLSLLNPDKSPYFAAKINRFKTFLT